MTSTTIHGRDSYSHPLPSNSISFRQKMRFSATCRVFIPIVMIVAGLCSCSIVSITKKTAADQTAFQSSPEKSNVFYHPLIYQLALVQEKQLTLLPQEEVPQKLTRQNLQLLQLSVNSFYLLFLLVLIMFCLLLIPKKVFTLFGIRKKMPVIKYGTSFKKNVPGCNYCIG